MKNISEETLEELSAVFTKAVNEAYTTGLEEGREGVASTVDEPKTKFKTEKRNAQVGERILIVNSESTIHQYGNGDVGTVKNVQYYGVGVEEWERKIYHSEYEVIIEDEIPLQDGPPYAVAPVKSPNQQRAKLNQRAEEFVEKYTKHNSEATAGTGVMCRSVVVIPNFIVNDKKRTVVVLLGLVANTNQIVAKGIAKCMPGDVFNEWIGKAIALCKALEIDIPDEFMHAVQPTELVVGHYVINNYQPDLKGHVTKMDSKWDKKDGKAFRHTHDSGFMLSNRVTIIDDTNAEYSS